VIRKYTTSAVDAGEALGAWLARRLGVSEADARARVVAGAVYVGGRRERDPVRRLTAGERIAVHEVEVVAGGGWRVVVEESGLLVVEKPAGLPVAAGRAGGTSLDVEVAAAYPGATLAHRIDRDTSGLVLFALDAGGRRRVAGWLEGGALRRLYVAAVEGAPGGEVRIDAPIGPDPADPRRMRAGVPGGKEAASVVRVRRRGGGRAILEVELETGRTHQIRVHLAAAGWPILGDRVYGGRVARRLALHAAVLEWPGRRVESPVPEEIEALVP
jgi:23S rRNA pseudouridine1911/1915/1917 synthase